MSYEYPDIVEITPVETSETWNEVSRGTPFQLDAYVEDDSKIRRGRDGEPILPLTIILFPKGSNVHKGDGIRIIKLHGLTPTTDEAVSRRIGYASRVGASIQSHVEAIV